MMVCLCGLISETFHNIKVTMKSIIQYARNRFGGTINVAKTFFVEFCDNSSIHGVRYFTERRLHWSERLWWLIAIAVSLWICGSLTRNIWNDWNKKPVTFSFTEREEPFAAIPFPQVTICPENKISKKRLDIIETLRYLSNSSAIQMEQLSTLTHICPRFYEQQLKLVDHFANESIYKLIRTMAQTEYEYIISCLFSLHFDAKACDVVPVLTEEGLCETYNALNSSTFYTDEMASGMKIVHVNSEISDANWHFETPFNYSWENRYPMNVHVPGRYFGLIIDLGVEIGNVSHQCDSLNRGFKVSLNVPGESVRISKNFIRIPPEEDTRIIIKPKITYTSEELRSYDPNQRQCYFDSERNLRFFHIYSQSNCEEECLAKFTKIECGCVKFNMPRDNKTRICGGAKIKCYKLAERKFMRDSVESFREQCNCLPSCTTIEYNFEVERTIYNAEPLKEVQQRNHTRKEGAMYVYYEGKYPTTVKRIPVYSNSDFLANCGGLLGLFLGVSLLSIIELAFFATLRLFWATRPPKSSEALTLIQQKLSKLRLVRAIRWFFVELCDNSNIHGILYFTRQKLHWSERLWWIVSIGISIWLCYLFIYNFWLRWNENLVKLSFSENPVSISTIPLPTITICTCIKAFLSRLNGTTFETLKDHLLEPRFDKLEYRVLYHVNALPYITFRSIQAYRSSDKESTEIYEIIQKVAPQMNELFENCWWKNELINCSEYFVPILTEEGLCFAFNAMNSHEIYSDEMAPGMKIVKNNPTATNWSLERGYADGSGYPMRLLDSNDETTLKISFSVYDDEIDLDYKLYDSDFKVVFTMPGDTAHFANNFHRVPLSMDSRISISPKKTTTSAGLRSYSANQRKCYFESERKLRFYKIYTQFNCEQECLTNCTIQEMMCQCGKFFLPRDNNYTICGLGQFSCSNWVESIFPVDGRVLEANDWYMYEVYVWIRDKCNCLPTCTTIEYNADIDSIELQKQKTNLNDKNGRRIQRTELTISFGNSVEIVERLETYTFTEFLAICGGLLGLFMGISALSIIELFYLCTLRWFWKWRRERTDSMADVLEPRTINVVPISGQR